MSNSPSSPWVLILKGILSGLAYVLGGVIGGAVTGTVAALHVTTPDLTPAGVSKTFMFCSFLLASTLLGLGLTPLASGTGASRRNRSLALFLLVFICLGVNTTIELNIFSTAFAHGGAVTLAASFLFPALFCALGLATLRTDQPSEPSFSVQLRTFFSSHSPAFWIWRLALAILAFPVVYFVFGMMVGSFVVDTYRAGVAGLILPPVSVIIPTQLLRSTLFLLVSLPFVILWKRSRLSLVLSLGLAHWVMVGLFGLAQAVWFPRLLRILHSVEIGADSFAYAAALVLLLLPRVAAKSAPTTAPVASVFPS